MFRFGEGKPEEIFLFFDDEDFFDLLLFLFFFNFEGDLSLSKSMDFDLPGTDDPLRFFVLAASSFSDSESLFSLGVFLEASLASRDIILATIWSDLGF